MLVAGYGGVRYGLPFVNRLLADDLEFEPVDRPAGFRRMKGGASSSGFDLFVGLPGDDRVGMAETVALVEARVCDALYGNDRLRDGTVPVASFSDYNCPYCRVLTQRLARMESASDGALAVSWHELPLLGEASRMAARGALAAKRQGAYIGFHERLMRTPFQATSDYLTVLAQDLGIDADRLIADMDSAAVRQEIRESRALSQVFGFIGTPALVVGRTVVQGEIGEATLAQLIARERADGPITACA